ncbi:MFS transporter [Sulfitobacter guttiformis]|uniref:MFS transporter n=1 Tax=Sulfitobacter guttiformis TaxID=74349 RepID=UPI00046A300B|nr:MFS transporter [Sulfitobacter guttiformis]
MVSRQSTLHVLRHSVFASLWFATLVSNLGGLVQGVAAAWLMTTLSDSRSLVALVQASTTLPVVLFSLPSGALADSFDRRGIMLVALCWMLCLSVLLSVFAYFGMLTPWLLLAFTFLIGSGQALFNPSWQSSMGDIVPKEDIPAAVTLNGMGFNMMRSVGPAIGGIVVTFAGVATAFALNAVSYFAIIAGLVRWHPPVVQKLLPREAFGPSISSGVRYVLLSPVLLRVMCRSFVFGLGAVVILALLPVLARNLLGGSALTYGILLGCFGFGAIGGGLLSGRLRTRFENEWIVRAAFVVMAMGVLALGLSRNMVLSGLILLPCGASWVLALSLFNVTVQLSTPRWVVGRALAIYQMAAFGGMAAGAWLWGAIAEQVGAPLAVVFASLPLIFGAAIGLKFPLENFSTRDFSPLNKFIKPSLKLDLAPRSGPIMVIVDYEIGQSDVPAFLALMVERRRIRIRDGARQWVLMRDLENPEIWTESYHVPTWVEYLRHHERRVTSDGEVYQNLLALHKGAKPPQVRRMIERQTVPRDNDVSLRLIPEEH